MLVCAREEENLIPFQSLVTGKDVRSNGGVGMADVWDIVDIVDGGGDVEGPFRFRTHGW